MNETELMLKGLAQVTGIKLAHDKNGMVNMTKFIEDYRDKFPERFRQRFGDASPNEVIALFFKEKYN
jgi:hypothetical protein